MSPIIEIDHLSKQYAGGTRALDDVSLSIEQGVGGPEILSFVPTDPDALGIPRRRRRTKPHPGDKL